MEAGGNEEQPYKWRGEKGGGEERKNYIYTQNERILRIVNRVFKTPRTQKQENLKYSPGDDDDVLIN